MEKILIIGSKGQLGKALVSLSNNLFPFVATDKTDLDITDKKSINVVFSEVKPTIVINAAAYTNVDEAEINTDLAYDVNSFGPKNLAEACNQIGAILIHISTDYVFNGKNNDPYKENEKVDPVSVYGKSKYMGEEFIRNVCSNHIILRTAWVFSENKNNFVHTILQLAKTKDKLEVVSDQFGGPTSAYGISMAILKIIDKILTKSDDSFDWGTYHFSGSPFVSWHEFARIILRQAKISGLINNHVSVNPVSSNEFKTKALRPSNSCLDCSLINKNFGIEPDNWNAQLIFVINKLKKGNKI